MYDVTSFLDDHPGGDEVLITATGKIIWLYTCLAFFSSTPTFKPISNMSGFLQGKMQQMILKMWATVILQER